MADNMAATTAAAPATKSARTGHQQDERTAADAVPPSSNSWVAMTPADPEVPRSVPMTAEDERHMKEDLHRDPAELLHRQLDNQGRMEQRKEALQQAAPGNNLDDVAAADAVGINAGEAAAAAPRPTAEQMDSNRVGAEDKMAEGPFLRRETGT
ncbi:hypothetical protein OEZ85_011437 [Tetradesmus obliquus]|uniref:Uncharacterized protein n=1 Tax=Tetradesmus obliquus TaxID=3088 RepID=A0ABY8TR08_TETOB|nr:hypothetical protein OEZ85_011437 [Tetradesmus obliquus]